MTALHFCSARIGARMVSSYPLPEGFSDFDVFSLGSCLLVEGECSFAFALEFGQILRGLRPAPRAVNL